MEGVELQFRTQLRPTAYPLSPDQRIDQGDRFRQSRKKLEVSLRDIEHFYLSSQVGAHTAAPNCQRCHQKKRRIVDAYYEYYVANDPGSNGNESVQFRIELEKMLNNPEKDSLENVHASFQRSLREHLQLDLCTPQSTDASSIHTFKSMLAGMFHQGKPTAEILSFYLDSQIRSSHDPDIAGFIGDIQNTTTADQRAQIYVKYYCNNDWNDSSQQKNFKAKYARMFEQLLTHDTVVSAMRKDAEDSQSRHISALKNKIGELQMAQSAHLKNKARKAEKDQRMHDRDEEPKMVRCGLPGCENDVNLAEETLECSYCDWLVRKGADKGRVYYCSVDHCEDDFDEHDRNDHHCCMGSECYYHPQSGPPEETGAGGVCPNCAEYEISSYFCSQECYRHNLDAHRGKIHYGRGIQNDTDRLETFRPAADMEIISS